MRRLWLVGVGLLLAACTVPAASALPACPARAEVEIEVADPVNFSLPRAVSADGAHIVTSRVLGSSVVLSVRPAGAGAVGHTVGSLSLGELDGGAPRVSIQPSASGVLFAGNQYASLPSEQPSSLYRWDSATDLVTEVSPPSAASPPPGVPYPVNLRRLSADGRRVLWSQAFYSAPSTFQYVRTITDAATDAIIWQGDADFGQTWSPGGHWATGPSTVVNPEASEMRDVASAVAALATAYPGTDFRPVATSDNGRFTYFDRYNPLVVPGEYDGVLWDWQTATADPVSLGDDYRQQLVMLDDDGSVVRADPQGAGRANLLQTFVGGGQRLVGTAARPVWADLPDWAMSSADLRTVLYSQDTVLGFRLLAARCT